jgi:hypothetical protein
VSRSFELLQLAYAWKIQQPVQTTLTVRSSFRISFQTQIWEDCCNRPDDVDSLPDALIHKASIAIQIQTSGRQQHGLDVCASDMEIGCIRLTVRTPILLVWTRGASIWKLRMCDRLDDSASPSGRGYQTGKIFRENFGISVAQLSV